MKRLSYIYKTVEASVKTLIRECAETKELRGGARIICNKTVSKTKRRRGGAC